MTCFLEPLCRTLLYPFLNGYVHSYQRRRSRPVEVSYVVATCPLAEASGFDYLSRENKAWAFLLCRIGMLHQT